MNTIFDVALTNLLSPMILFFILGIIAVIVNSDLKVPDALYNGYTMIILLTIGIKGGIELAGESLFTMIPAAVTGITLTLVMAAITYMTLRYVYKFSFENTLAVAAHYGSVSAVTFIAGLTFLDKSGVYYESYLSALLVLMEGPAIIAVILLYTYKLKTIDNHSSSNFKYIFKEAFFGKSIFLLLGGLIIGMVADREGMALIEPFFGELFYGILCIFLLHMGMVATQQLVQMEDINLKKFSFAFILPLVGGLLGVLAGTLIGMSVGGATMLGVLTGSASYIAAPATIEQSIPEANSGLYIGSSLGLTLPFNLIVGIPLYFWLANVL